MATSSEDFDMSMAYQVLAGIGMVQFIAGIFLPTTVTVNCVLFFSYSYQPADRELSTQSPFPLRLTAAIQVC